MGALVQGPQGPLQRRASLHAVCPVPETLRAELEATPQTELLPRPQCPLCRAWMGDSRATLGPHSLALPASEALAQRPQPSSPGASSGPGGPLCPTHLLPRPRCCWRGVSRSNASSLRIPRLKAQAGPTFQGNTLSPPTPSPAHIPIDRGAGGEAALHPSWGPSTQIRIRGAGQGGRPRGHRCGPSSDLGWHPERDIEPRGAGDTGRGCRGSGVTAEAPVRPGSGSSCSPLQGPRGRWDSKKIPAKCGSRCGGAAGRAAPEGQWLSLG